jgi:prophage antirepressor-like protein
MPFGLRQGKPVILVNESGLYKLAARSDKPQAKLFIDWVTREVLPSIRKTGTYALADHGRDQMPGGCVDTSK